MSSSRHANLVLFRLASLNRSVSTGQTNGSCLFDSIVVDVFSSLSIFISSLAAVHTKATLCCLHRFIDSDVYHSFHDRAMFRWLSNEEKQTNAFGTEEKDKEEHLDGFAQRSQSAMLHLAVQWQALVDLFANVQRELLRQPSVQKPNSTDTRHTRGGSCLIELSFPIIDWFHYTGKHRSQSNVNDQHLHLHSLEYKRRFHTGRIRWSISTDDGSKWCGIYDDYCLNMVLLVGEFFLTSVFF